MIPLRKLWKVGICYEPPDWGFGISICFSSLATIPGKLRFPGKQSLLQELICFHKNELPTNLCPIGVSASGVDVF
jgi:hypothetical protein